MPDILLIKRDDGSLIPATDDAVDQVARLKVGEMYLAKVTHKRNGKFFRKWFCLMKYAFGLFEETHTGVIYKGVVAKPDFERFRHDIVIMAGFYKTVVNAMGEVRLVAESVSPDNMDEARFELLYSASLDVLVEKVFKTQNKTAEQINQEVNRLMIFS